MNVVAVVDAPAPGLRTVSFGAVAAVLDDRPLHPGEDPVLRHGAAVDQVFSVCPAVLPTRAGTRLADEGAVRTWLEAQHDALRRALDGVRGAAEFAVTWRAPSAEQAPTDGADYLRGVVARWSVSREARRRLEATRDLPGVRAIRVLSHLPTVVKGSVLIDRTAAGQVAQRLKSLDADRGDWRTSGPFPPYSFAAGEQ